MIKITIPNNNIIEREYIIDIIFNEFLGLKYSLDIGERDYKIILGNQKNLTIKDTFFNKYPKDLEYLSKDNIPKSIKELDSFAACFFMLTRWEEYVNKNRDMHNRFPASESLAYQEGFLDRPIVNEIIEQLKEKLLELDESLIFRKRKFGLTLTHDIDEIMFWKSKKQLLRIVLGDILKRRDIKLAFKRIKEYYLVAKGKIKDPFDTFDWLMDRSEEIGVKSQFYFMSGGMTKYDSGYNIKRQRVLFLEIKKRGHVIGIHPSYNTFNNIKQLEKEKKFLEEVSGVKVEEGREHYLRFEVPTTWQIWEDSGLKVDSSCGYAEMEGFRCGTGDEFSVFNILTRKKLMLKERPLIIMDSTLFEYHNYSYSQAKMKILTKEQHGNITLLFHNSTIQHFGFYQELLAKGK